MAYLSGEKLKQNKAGFTLIEMITSISLIVIITTIFIANYNTGNKRTDLIMTAQKLVADIHAAQNNALGLVKYGEEVPAGGWGLSFSIATPKKYTLFADLNRPESTELGQAHQADPGYMEYDPSTEGLINQGARVVDLPKGIEIIGISTSDSSQTVYSSAQVSFLPPDPKTNIYNNYSTSSVLRVTLREASTGKTKIIRVNFLGLVEVIN
ncbi:MAG: prepilin-type N-terminal cleavage/methylation domain-containing protein [Candidatus Falkowbacteria bacterium]